MSEERFWCFPIFDGWLSVPFSRETGAYLLYSRCCGNGRYRAVRPSFAPGYGGISCLEFLCAGHGAGRHRILFMDQADLCRAGSCLAGRIACLEIPCCRQRRRLSFASDDLAAVRSVDRTAFCRWNGLAVGSAGRGLGICRFFGHRDDSSENPLCETGAFVRSGMKKVIVIGCPGGGKSTFARMLYEKTGLPLYYLDQMYWNADRTTVDRAVFHERLRSTIEKESWIIDGNYGSTMEMRMEACDTVFFLDYSLEVCLSGIEDRRGKSRPDMPWVETEGDEEFIAFIKNYSTDSRPKVMELLGRYSDKNIVIFKTRAEAAAFLENM